MKTRMPATLLLLMAFVLLDCALAFADDDWSFSRSGRHSSGGHSGPMSSGAMAAGLAFAGVAFGAVCGALVFAHTWLFASLAAAKILAALAVFSFLAWPVFLIALFPPAVALSLVAGLYADVAPSDPNGALFTLITLALAAFLYCYLLNVLLAVFSPAPWGKRMACAFAGLAVAGGIVGIARGSIPPFLLFALFALCAWLAWRAYGKIAARAGAKKRRIAGAG